jgi:hypothetical protein
VTFPIYPWRFSFSATGSILFPAGKSGNILRGAFGTIFRKLACVPDCPGVPACEFGKSCAYARIFEPAAGSGPSGLADWPRPFVFRASHLDGRTIAPGEPFWFGLNVFDIRDPALPHFVLAFSQLANEGLGPGRGSAVLTDVSQLDAERRPAVGLYHGSTFLVKAPPPPLGLALSPDDSTRIRKVYVRFATPTELKSGAGLAPRPEFAILFARIRDRVSTLRTLYGGGPLEIDFRAMGERAAAIRLTRCDLHQVAVERRSSRTGQVHPIGGFIGEAEYEGNLAEFLPYLKAAEWTGVGRQTVWGKGEIQVIATP